jgi:hypothetical protein
MDAYSLDIDNIRVCVFFAFLIICSGVSGDSSASAHEMIPRSLDLPVYSLLLQ